jgi:undecaprenyl diphosphate synthase
MNKGLTRLPQHVAIIMDGNGRWAEQRSLPRALGHEAGARAVRSTVEACREMGIGWLTLYAFSQENWARPADEVAALMDLLVKFLQEEQARLDKNEIRLRAIGRLDKLPEKSRRELQRVCDETASHGKMTLTLALSYGGRDEIVDAARKLVAQARDGKLAPEDVGPENFAAGLYAPDMPDPDLLVRTSGEMRISNFLLWQLAYSEIYVTDVLWPDFDRMQLERAIEAYAKRERRFGKTGAQTAADS